MIREFAPRLGILQTDAPSQNMVIVRFHNGKIWRWAYVTKGHLKDQSYPLESERDFTPLQSFGVHATMTDDAQLALHQITVSIATYHNGNPRQWQGASESKVKIFSRFGGWVVDAVHEDFESRRAKRAAVRTDSSEPMMAPKEPENAALS